MSDEAKPEPEPKDFPDPLCFDIYQQEFYGFDGLKEPGQVGFLLDLNYSVGFLYWVNGSWSCVTIFGTELFVKPVLFDCWLPISNLMDILYALSDEEEAGTYNTMKVIRDNMSRCCFLVEGEDFFINCVKIVLAEFYRNEEKQHLYSRFFPGCSISEVLNNHRGRG